MRVVDYKTGRSPSEHFEAKALFQMKFYALVLWRLRGEIPKRLQLVYLGNSEIVAYEPDEQDLLGTERKVKALWAAMSEQPRPVTGDPARAGCATGATTRHCAPPGAARHPHCPTTPPVAPSTPPSPARWRWTTEPAAAGPDRHRTSLIKLSEAPCTLGVAA